MRTLCAVVICSIVASSLSACTGDTPTEAASAHDAPRVENGGGFGSGTRSDTTTTQTTAPTSSEEGGEVEPGDTKESGGGFGSGT